VSPPGRRPTGFLLCLIAGWTLGCDPPPHSDAAVGHATGAALTLVDAEGRSVELAGEPARIVSLVPSATETLRALGETGRLVGRTDFDTATALTDLPSVGGGLQPSGEVLLALRPELVIRFAGPTDRDTPRLLDEAGIPHLAVRPERIAEVQAMIRSLGRLTGRTARADSILARQAATLAAIRTRVEAGPAVRVAFTLGGDPPFVAGAGTFVGELMENAGGENVFADLDRPWSGVSPETIVDRAPDLLLTLEGTRLDPRLTRGRTVRHVPALAQLPGPALDRAALAIARAIHPGTFGPAPGGRDDPGGPGGRQGGGSTRPGASR
jgi:ABC-type Fe3+-hydroxamate transport system substrate-binding protein